MQWEVVPEGLYESLMWVHGRIEPKELLVTENGAAYPDPVSADGVVHDADRETYLARHLNAAADAIDAGAPLRGYYVWSLMDNFEWSLGYSKRFGVVHVDYADAEAHAQAERALVSAAISRWTLQAIAKVGRRQSSFIALTKRRAMCDNGRVI